MRKIVFRSASICIALILGITTVSIAADKVGYINLQKLINDSEMGKAAKNNIQKLRQEREALLKEKLAEVNKLKDYINKEGSKMDPNESRDQVQLFNKAYKDYQRLLADAKDDIANEDRDLVAVILQKADPVLKKVARQKEYTIILKDPNAIGYLDPGVDITDDVLKELNK